MGAIHRKLVRASYRLRGQFQPKKPFTGKPKTMKKKANLNLKLIENTAKRSQMMEKARKTYDAEMNKLFLGENPPKTLVGAAYRAAKAKQKAIRVAQQAFIERRKKAKKLMKERAKKQP